MLPLTEATVKAFVCGMSSYARYAIIAANIMSENIILRRGGLPWTSWIGARNRDLLSTPAVTAPALPPNVRLIDGKMIFEALR